MKKNVRELARKYNLPTANREESMGICFVGEKRKFDGFLGIYKEHVFSLRLTFADNQRTIFLPSAESS